VIHLFNLHNKSTSFAWEWYIERLMLVLPIWIVMVLVGIYGTVCYFQVDINHLEKYRGDVSNVHLMLILSLVIPTLIFAIDLPISYYLAKRKEKSRENLIEVAPKSQN